MSRLCSCIAWCGEDCAAARHVDKLKEGARHPAALPSVPMFADVPAPGPIAPPAPNLDLFRATQERLPL